MRHTENAPENPDTPETFRLSSYVYDLPEERIARRPAEKRDGSRLLVLNRQAEPDAAGTVDAFARLPEILAERFPKGALLIANNSRVFPAASMAAGPRAGGWSCFCSPLCRCFT